MPRVKIRQRRGRPPKSERPTPGEVKVRLYRRAMAEAERFRKLSRAKREHALPVMQRALDLFYRAEPKDGFVGGPSRYRFALRFPSKTYQVSTTSLRDFARLLDVWQQYLVGPWKRGSVTLRKLHLGIRYEFGPLFAPPLRETHADLARVFKIKRTTVQSWLRRYSEITAHRSVL